jgi:DNA-directed RNA polymerase subunit RPC12/RpoP
MQHSWIQQSFQEIEHPECAKCGAPMWLTRIGPYEPDHDRRTFECQACGNSKFEIVKFR